MIKERNRAATVVKQSDDLVEVEHNRERLTVPTDGFPPGFKLRPGARVILVEGSTGLVAKPLVRAIESRLQPASINRREPLEVQGRRVELQDSTILDDRPETKTPTDDYVVWVVERGEGDASEQAIAVRRR